ncbi:HlyD family secretion protein [Sphingobium nicotianae]|uniref:HlyD family secretion protein n=1 Tax=Sphingobium nicotianae TaxID=2782607 RepID=A0A9X1DFJ6_9SPHN|nr:HlyD family secretion protein [Sphingobium nicotianae]MBT2189050.1 HlyD family secretion protein [Sphingobium nicotianae]
MAQDNDTDDKPAQRISGRARIILLVAALVLVVGGAFWFAYHQMRGKYYEETNDAEIRADMVTVAPRIAGYVSQVLVSDNQDVKAGQPLLRIDARDYEARQAQADAQIAVARAAADNVRATISEQLATIDQTRAQLAQARAKAAYDAAEVARYAPLVETGAEKREQLAQLRATATQSAAQVRAQEAALAVQQRRVGTLESQIRQSDAQAQGARAQRASANVDVNATLVRAASDGRIGDKTVTMGQFVQPGMRLMSIVPLDKIYVVANFKETQLGLIRPGQPATISVDALGGTELHGKVASIMPGTGAQFSILPPENATGNFTKIVQRVPVRIELDASPEARRLLVPGLSVTATVDTISARDAGARIKDAQARTAAKAN